MMVVWRLLLAIGLPALAQSWVPVESGTTANLRGVSVNGNSVWVSGDKGTVLRRSVVGGAWFSISPKGVADLDFRDIEAVDERTAFLMSSGEGPQSRIYKTTDGGASWLLLATNLEPKGFWDCMSFWDSTHGIIVGDPVDGRFTILTTIDGVTWQKVKGPRANKDEGAFAASGTCVFTRGTREVWFGTGGVGGARVFHSQDGGQTWSTGKTPIRHDSANAGIFSLAFSDASHGVAIGGDYMKPNESAGTIAITNDGGKTWSAGTLPGYRSSLTYIASADVWFATGTGGTDYSVDGGSTWRPWAPGDFNAFSDGWAVGSKGNIATLNLDGLTVMHRAPH
jgi:photosystem II stability/assembly factor-like uncharacterized protein